MYVTAPAGAGKAFCDGTWGVVGARFETCCTAEDKTTFQYALGRGLFLLVTNRCEGDLEASIAKGRLLYDPGLSAACQKAFNDVLNPTTCSATMPSQMDLDAIQSGACKTAFVGTVPEGMPCSEAYECAPGTACVGYTQASVLSPDAGPGTDGTCVKTPGIGQACGQGSRDGGTGAIDESFDPPACVDGAYCPGAGQMCAPKKTDGQTCSKTAECANGLSCHRGTCNAAGASDVDGPCKVNDDCKSGLYCDKPSTADGTCKQKKVATSACTGALSSECQGRCSVPDGSSDGTCVTFCGSN